MNISYSDGRTVPDCVIQIWDDRHEERDGFYRAFWCATPDASSGSPVVGYCSPGGSFRTIKAAARDALRRYPGERVYRNGREVRP
jgi:hypothetical protein